MKVFSPRGWAIALVAIALALSAQPAKASFWTFTDVSGRSASADFSLSGNTLTITLSNTASGAITAPNQVLTALFFSYSTGGVSSANTALSTGGSANYTTPQYFGDVGGEWGAKSNVNGFNYGLSSTGLGDFGPGDTINDNDLTPPGSPDGLQWGIVNPGYVDGTGNGGVEDSPMSRGTVTFTLTVSSGFNPDNITSTFFLYGTAYGEGGGGGGGGGNAVPAPAGLILLATAVPVFAFRRLIRRKPAAA
jgi:hypothetical protein